MNESSEAKVWSSEDQSKKEKNDLQFLVNCTEH